MAVQEYRVRIEQFEGPLDLLLHLISRAEVDITAISIAQITDQYLAYLDDLRRVNVDDAGEFLVLAAALIEIKSRFVTPEMGQSRADLSTDDDGSMTAEELAADLIQQLLAYKAYRDAADGLDARREQWARRYPSGRAAMDREALLEAARSEEDLDLEDLELVDLVAAFQKIAETVQFDRIGEHNVTYDDTPIEEHAADILDRLQGVDGARVGEAGIPLVRIFEGHNRSQIVGLFLATLELIRQRRVLVRQNPDADQATSPGDSILIALRDDPEPELHPVEAEAEPMDWEDDHILGDDDPDDEDGEFDEMPRVS